MCCPRCGSATPGRGGYSGSPEAEPAAGGKDGHRRSDDHHCLAPAFAAPRGRAPEAVSASVRPRLVRHVLKLPTTPSRGHHDRGLRQRPSVFRDPCPGRDRAVEPDRNRYPSRTGHRSTSWTPLGDPEQGPRPPASTAVRDGRCVETRSSRAYPRRSTVTVTNP